MIIKGRLTEGNLIVLTHAKTKDVHVTLFGWYPKRPDNPREPREKATFLVLNRSKATGWTVTEYPIQMLAREAALAILKQK